VVIAHDYVTQRGGAERTVLGLLEAFPGARLVTSLFAPDRTFPEFADVDVDRRERGNRRDRPVHEDPELRVAPPRRHAVAPELPQIGIP